MSVGAAPPIVTGRRRRLKRARSGRIAQLVEHLDHNQGVTGSSPVPPTTSSPAAASSKECHDPQGVRPTNPPASPHGRPRAPGPHRARARTGMSRQDIPVSFAMRESVTEEIDRLWTLRGLDEELVTLNAALRRFPEERAAIARQLAGERAPLDQAKARLAELQKQRRAVEQEISGLTETERKFQNQLMAVKKNEEYKALQHEIAGVRGQRSDLETRVLEHLEAEDRENAERPALERGLAAAEQEAAARLARIDAEERADRERVAALEAERSGFVAGLQPAVRSRYERVRGSLDGRALVAIVKGACGGCFRAQPPQVIQEARKRDRVLSCEGCGRMLLWPPDGA